MAFHRTDLFFVADQSLRDEERRPGNAKDLGKDKALCSRPLRGL